MTGGGTAAAPRDPESGFSLVAAAATITIMLIMMGAAVPSWKYVMQNMREEELLFRGIQIAEAVERYQKLHGGAPPNSLDDLVKARCLRKAYADPMSRDGKWRLVSPGEAGGMFRRGGRLRRRGLGGGAVEGLNVGDRLGGLQGFVGVASNSDEKSFRIFNGQTTYDQWQFIAGQPRIIGRPRTIGAVPGAGAIPGLPGAPGAPGIPGLPDPAQTAPPGAPVPRPSPGQAPAPDR